LKFRRQQRVESLTGETVRAELAAGSMYWSGYDNERRPVLWVRPAKKDWKGMDRVKEAQAHIVLIELGLRRFLPPGVTQFTLCTDAAGLGLSQFDPALMKVKAGAGAASCSVVCGAPDSA
jgi:hypothetical protein